MPARKQGCGRNFYKTHIEPISFNLNNTGLYFILSEFFFYRSGIKRNCDELEYKFLHYEVKIVTKIVHRCSFKKPAEALRIVRVKMRVRISSIDYPAAQVAEIGLKIVVMKMISFKKIYCLPRKCRTPSCYIHLI